jgi:type IV pilus assembly protein PilM
MEFLPSTLGTRPRLACEVRAEGIVAARAEDASGILSAVARATLPEGTVAPQLRAGNLSAARPAVVAALRKTLEGVALRTREVTLIVPDAAVRVLLLDFDALPSKPAEALPVVRFRLKKLLPFDADDAAISYQTMSTARGIVRVVAVAMPREVLAEYESAVRDAGFEPGAVLPSTLAALAGLPEGESPTLLVNAGLHGVTTAIVKSGILLLHRSVDLGADLRADAASAPPPIDPGLRLPLVDRETSAEEWALQEPVGFDDPIEAAAAVQTAVLEQELTVEHNMAVAAGEVAQAVSVAAAYFEDTLETSPGTILAAGPMGAETLGALLAQSGVGPVQVAETLDRAMLGPGITSGVPLGWLAGVRGALTD